MNSIDVQVFDDFHDVLSAFAADAVLDVVDDDHREWLVREVAVLQSRVALRARRLRPRVEVKLW